MEIIIARHADAETGEGKPDGDRELTSLGREQSALLGQVILATLGTPAELWSSPLQRAHETATVAASKWTEKRVPRISQELVPGFDPDQVCWTLSRFTQPLVMLVAHMPDVGTLAARLLGLRTPLVVPKAGVVIVRTRDPLKPVGQAVASLVPEQYADILAGRQYAPWMRTALRVHPAGEA